MLYECSNGFVSTTRMKLRFIGLSFFDEYRDNIRLFFSALAITKKFLHCSFSLLMHQIEPCLSKSRKEWILNTKKNFEGRHQI